MTDRRPARARPLPYPGRTVRIGILSLTLILLTAWCVVQIVRGGVRPPGAAETAGVAGAIALGGFVAGIVYALLGRPALWAGLLLVTAALVATHWGMTLPSSLAVDALRWSPLAALLTLAALSAVPPELHEAAAVDRAGPAMRLRRITLPLVGPLLLLGVAFCATDVLVPAERRAPATRVYAAMIGAIVAGFILARRLEARSRP